MEPFAVLTIKLFDDKDHESETQYGAISTIQHRRKLLAALKSELEVWQGVASRLDQPFVTLTIKLADGEDSKIEMLWTGRPTPDHQRQLVEALTVAIRDNVEISKRVESQAHASSDAPASKS